jgi:hypothetical protein
MTFGTAGTTKATLDSSGNLGIGTSSPSAKLNVVGSADVSAIVESTGTSHAASLIARSGNGTTSGLYAYARFVNNDTNAQDWRIGTYGNNNLSIVNAKTATVPVVLDTSGNLGLGVTPSAWGGGSKVIDVASTGSFESIGGNSTSLSYNRYFNGTNNIYKTTGFSSIYALNSSGQHVWYTAPSGTAGNAITFSQAMTLDASGRLMVGNTSAQGPGVTATNGFYSLSSDGTSVGSITSFTGYTTVSSYKANGAYLRFDTADTGGSVTEKMRLDSSGNLGLGVTPSAWGASIRSLDLGLGSALTNANSTSDTWLSSNAYYTTQWLYKNNAAASYYRQANAAHYWYTAPSGTAGNAITFTQAMTLDASGNLLVGTTSNPSSPKFRVNGIAAFGGANTNIYQGELSSTATYIQSLTIAGAAADLVFYNTSERARIDSSGNLLVGTTSGSYSQVLKVNANNYAFGITNNSATNPYGLYLYHANVTGGTGQAFLVCADTGSNRLVVAGNGNVTNINNSYGAISDLKLKENITDATPKLDKLMQVRVVNYNLKTEPAKKQLGVIAQELEQVFPGLVEESVDKDQDNNALGTTTKSVKYSVFVPMLIKAIQEQQALITKLTDRITALEARCV